jgi:hypothetical protein
MDTMTYFSFDMCVIPDVIMVGFEGLLWRVDFMIAFRFYLRMEDNDHRVISPNQEVSTNKTF